MPIMHVDTYKIQWKFNYIDFDVHQSCWSYFRQTSNSCDISQCLPSNKYTLKSLPKHLMANPLQSLQEDNIVHSVHFCSWKLELQDSRKYGWEEGYWPKRPSLKKAAPIIMEISILLTQMVQKLVKCLNGAYKGMPCALVVCTSQRLLHHLPHTLGTRHHCSTPPPVPPILILRQQDADLHEYTLVKLTILSLDHTHA